MFKLVQKVHRWFVAVRIARNAVRLRKNNQLMDNMIRLRCPYSSPEMLRLADNSERLRTSISSLVSDFTQLRDAS